MKMGSETTSEKMNLTGTDSIMRHESAVQIVRDSKTRTRCIIESLDQVTLEDVTAPRRLISDSIYSVVSSLSLIIYIVSVTKTVQYMLWYYCCYCVFISHRIH